MDFTEQLKQFSKRVESLKPTLSTEEATKTAIIMPFFSMLGYDIFNPQEFIPEYTADVGIKKGEHVDYAIVIDGKPVMLIECKSIIENLSKHDSQLFRYFGTTSAKFAILTNGQVYKFYTDLENPNRMDEDPFLTVDILDLRENQFNELKKFCRASFDIEAIFNTASELKYVNEFKHIFSEQLLKPSDEFTRLFLKDCYSGQKNQNVIEQFRPLLKKALNDYISEVMNDKIKTALAPESAAPAAEKAPDSTKDVPQEKNETPKIITTEEELEAYFIVKNLLGDVVNIKDITYRDTTQYINILYKNNSRKWICRFRLSDTQKVLLLPDENKNEVKYSLTDIYDLQNYKDQLTAVLNRYL